MLREVTPKNKSRLMFVIGRLLRGRSPSSLAVAVPQLTGGGGTSWGVVRSGVDPAIFGGDPGVESCEVHLRGTKVRVTSMGSVTVLAEDGWTHRFVPAGWIAQVKA